MAERVGEGGVIWVTRAQPGAEATADRLRALGRRPLVASLLEVRRLAPPPELPRDLGALAFTSANGVKAFAAWTPRRDWPVFAVGDATAEAARAAGFDEVVSADGDVDALARRIAAAPPAGLILHACAREGAGDLAGALHEAGVRMLAAPLYETCAVACWPEAVATALQDGRLSTVLLHSPRAAAALARLCAVKGAPRLAGVRLLALSAACLAPAAHLPFASARAAARPKEAAMLELL